MVSYRVCGRNTYRRVRALRQLCWSDVMTCPAVQSRGPIPDSSIILSLLELPRLPERRTSFQETVFQLAEELKHTPELQRLKDVKQMFGVRSTSAAHERGPEYLLKYFDHDRQTHSHDVMGEAIKGAR